MQFSISALELALDWISANSLCMLHYATLHYTTLHYTTHPTFPTHLLYFPSLPSLPTYFTFLPYLPYPPTLPSLHCTTQHPSPILSSLPPFTLFSITPPPFSARPHFCTSALLLLAQRVFALLTYLLTC